MMLQMSESDYADAGKYLQNKIDNSVAEPNTGPRLSVVKCPKTWTDRERKLRYAESIKAVLFASRGAPVTDQGAWLQVSPRVVSPQYEHDPIETPSTILPDWWQEILTTSNTTK